MTSLSFIDYKIPLTIYYTSKWTHQCNKPTSICFYFYFLLSVKEPTSIWDGHWRYFAIYGFKLNVLESKFKLKFLLRIPRSKSWLNSLIKCQTCSTYWLGFRAIASIPNYSIFLVKYTFRLAVKRTIKLWDNSWLWYFEFKQGNKCTY